MGPESLQSNNSENADDRFTETGEQLQSKPTVDLSTANSLKIL